MTAFKATFLNELDKTYKKKKITFLAILSLVLVALVQLGLVLVRNQLGLKVVGSVEFPLFVLGIFSITILPLYTALITIDIFSGEYSNNTMKVLLTRPVSRFKILLAKVSAVAFFVLALLVFVMIISLLAGFIFNSVELSIGGLYRIMLAYIITLVPTVTLVLMIALLANHFRSGITVFFISIIAYLLLFVASKYFSQFDALFLVANLDWYKQWIGENVQVSSVIRKLFLLLGSDVMFFSGAFYLLDKKNL